MNKKISYIHDKYEKNIEMDNNGIRTIKTMPSVSDIVRVKFPEGLCIRGRRKEEFINKMANLIEEYGVY